MSDKRAPSPSFIANPFVKKRNLNWTLDIPPEDSLVRVNEESQTRTSPEVPKSAVIEAGAVAIDDHLTHFSSLLSSCILSSTTPQLSIADYSSLYTSNAGNSHGAHFVIHQHDHPVAGTHYDLRLQINETSSASWAIMYGLPGDPNSVRLNRNATETRIHCLWNHLIETASSATGPLLIWDTGTYTILPRRSKHAPSHDPCSPPGSPLSPSEGSPTQQALLHAAFQNRKIRIRLHGSKLPDPYILNLRLTKTEDVAGRERSSKTPKRRRRARGAVQTQPETSSDEEEDEDVIQGGGETGEGEEISAMEKEIRELEDEQVRQTNAYPGASNTIGSVHQRRWYLSLDRPGCGFVDTKQNGQSTWQLGQDKAKKNSSIDSHQRLHTSRNTDETGDRLSFPFYVRGVDHERSAVTGRRGADILRDEGVGKFHRRKGWNPVLN